MKRNTRSYKQIKVGKYILIEHSTSSDELRVWALPGGGVINNDQIGALRYKLTGYSK